MIQHNPQSLCGSYTQKNCGDPRSSTKTGKSAAYAAATSLLVGEPHCPGEGICDHALCARNSSAIVPDTDIQAEKRGGASGGGHSHVTAHGRFLPNKCTGRLRREALSCLIAHVER